MVGFNKKAFSVNEFCEYYYVCENSSTSIGDTCITKSDTESWYAKKLHVIDYVLTIDDLHTLYYTEDFAENNMKWKIQEDTDPHILVACAGVPVKNRKH